MKTPIKFSVLRGGLFAAAAFGLPGLANFVAEFFSLVGAYQVYPVHTMLAALGLIGSAIYGMALFQNSFQGSSSRSQTHAFKDLSLRELFVCSALLSLLIFIGFYPNLVLNLLESSQVAWLTNDVAGAEL